MNAATGCQSMESDHLAKASGPADKPAKESPKRRPGRPRASDAAHKEDPRSRLLRVAIEIFSKYGYDAVSTGDVARAADLSQPMVHYHFGSKEKLWRSALSYHLKDLGSMYPVDIVELKDLGPIDRLKVLTRRFMRMSGADPTLSRIVMHESLARSDRLDWLIDRYLKRGFTEFDEAVAEGIQRGLLRNLPVYVITNTIVNASSYVFCTDALVKRAYGVDVTERERIDEMSDAIIDILFKGLSVET